MTDKDGARVLSEEECAEVGIAVERWRELERENIETLRSGKVVDLAEEALPTLDDQGS